MDVSKKCLIGECWVPVADLAIVQNCLTEGSVSIWTETLTLPGYKHWNLEIYVYILLCKIM